MLHLPLGVPGWLFLQYGFKDNPSQAPGPCSQSLHGMLNHSCIYIFFFSQKALATTTYSMIFGKSSNNCTKTWGMMSRKSLHTSRSAFPHCGIWVLGLLCTGVPRCHYKRRMAKGFRGQQGTWRAVTGSEGPSLSGGISPFGMLVFYEMQKANAVVH